LKVRLRPGASVGFAGGNGLVDCSTTTHEQHGAIELLYYTCSQEIAGRVFRE